MLPGPLPSRAGICNKVKYPRAVGKEDIVYDINIEIYVIKIFPLGKPKKPSLHFLNDPILGKFAFKILKCLNHECKTWKNLCPTDISKQRNLENPVL